MNEQIFDALKAEKNEADALIDKGLEFTVPVRSLLRFVTKKKERVFVIHQPYLGTLDIISRLFLEIKIEEEFLKENPLVETKRIAVESARTCAIVVAVAVLNSKWLIRFFSKPLADYFFWRLKPDKLLQLALIINQISNLGDFISSIRLMSAVRTTTPRLIEEGQQG